MLSDLPERLQRFVDYAQKLKGDEKGEAQVFCDRLFQAFGHEGYKEAGATLEDRQHRRGKSVRFIDLLWKPRLILEMKSEPRTFGITTSRRLSTGFIAFLIDQSTWCYATLTNSGFMNLMNKWKSQWTACAWLTFLSAMMR